MPVSSTPLYEKQHTKENNVPYKESGMAGRGVGERNRSYCATVLSSRLQDCLETLGGSWGKGVPDFLLSPSHFTSGASGVSYFMPLQPCLSGRRWESQEAVICCSEPSPAHWGLPECQVPAFPATSVSRPSPPDCSGSEKSPWKDS